jgi:beta-galactosidase
LDSVLSAGISINMYMFHGGTTRGFMNGANYKDGTPFEPQVSSYDYDAPLDEAGNATDKFMQFRQVIAKHLPAGQTLPDVPAKKPTISIPAIHFNQSKLVFDIATTSKANPTPLSFESLQQDYGFVLYRTNINNQQTGVSQTIKINGLRDYALVYINGKAVGKLDRRLNEDSLAVTLPNGRVVLDILVENLGRINFGKYLLQNTKGIIGDVTLNGKALMNWNMFLLPFNKVDQLKWNASMPKTAGQPVVKKATFNLSAVGDTYFDMSQWGKGMVWINGHNLGRYWQVGPQQTLYVPVEWLKKGSNEVIILELLKPEQNELIGIDHAILDKVNK